jgi:hypothetical protein
MGVPIVAGSDPYNGNCTPAEMQALFTLWCTGQGNQQSYCDCWSGTPNTKPQSIAGGFIWSYNGTGSNFLDYMNAIENGLTSTS